MGFIIGRQASSPVEKKERGKSVYVTVSKETEVEQVTEQEDEQADVRKKPAKRKKGAKI